MSAQISCDSETAFIHAIDPTAEYSFYPCNNLSLSPFMSSPDAIACLNPEVGALHTSARKWPIEKLKQGMLPLGVLGPVAQYMMIAGFSRQGLQAQYGDGRPMEESKIRYSLQRADLEIAFEEARRECAPNAPSRLSCLWLADSSRTGREMISKMFPGSPMMPLHVKVRTVFSFFKADASYFTRYMANPHRGHAVSYWESNVEQNGTQWEYLLDGTIEFTEPAEIACLCKKHLESGAPPWSASNPAPVSITTAAERCPS